MTTIYITPPPEPHNITAEQVVAYLLRTGWQEPKWYQLARWFDRSDESIRLHLCSDGTVAPAHLSAFILDIARAESRPALDVVADIAGPASREVTGNRSATCADKLPAFTPEWRAWAKCRIRMGATAERWAKLVAFASTPDEDETEARAVEKLEEDIASLRATVARLNRRAQQAEATPPFPKTRKRAQRDRHDEAQARATLARMSTPTLTEFAAVATAALRDSSAAWNGMSDTEKASIKARVRYGLDYLASSRGLEPGDIYSAGPGDPPPTQPAT